MLKKLALSCCLFATTLATAHAAFYMGPSLSLIDNTSQLGNYRGLQPRINIGYNDMFSAYTYLAIEAFGSPSSILINNNTQSGPSLRSTYTYGLSLISGYMITDNVIGYLRLGAVEANFSSPNASQSGGQVGLGLQTPLTENWHLRTEYIYSAFSKASSIGSVKTDQVMLGLIYNFI
jgi:opacity protein-like surface antigen